MQNFRTQREKKKKEESTDSETGKTKPKMHPSPKITLVTHKASRTQTDSNLLITTPEVKNNKTMPLKLSDKINSNLFLGPSC